MSTTIDSRVVEMRFDNKQFEQNVQTTMSTLDKLKQKLNLSGAAKGLEELNTSANKVDMKGLSGALETVTAKFSALDVIGVTALANITNSAVNAAKQMLNTLLVAPRADGFKEYELMLTSVQTTMAGTGKTAEEVEEQLKSLDEYADKTVYSTADMLNNLPKFTNAGVDLEVATKAMIGIANATALAGGDAQKASIAFYNLGQSIGTGYLTRMDYNSINNAGIATMEWKERMIEAAIAAGTLTQVEEDLYQAGNKQLTLQQLFIDGLQEQWATADVLIEVLGDYGDETTDIGKKAYAAAQDIKTYSMMMDSLKATAGTGWKDTWQIIFGDLEDAKKFWTGLTNFISGIIEGIADFRNNLLESVLGRSFSSTLDTIKNVVDPIKKSAEAIKTVTKTTADYAKLVDSIIRGDWDNAPVRFERLAAAGYDYKHAQNLVNEKLGCAFRYATDYKEAQEDLSESQENVSETTNDLIYDLTKMSEAELKSAGYTEEQIAALKSLEKMAKRLGIPLKDFIRDLDEIDGRWILINSFKNAGQGLVAVINAIKEAWFDIFPTSGLSNGLFNMLVGLHRFSTYLRVSDEAAKDLKDTFKGVFSILDFAFTIIGGPIKIGLKILEQLFKALDVSMAGVLKFTGGIGRAITEFHDWVEELFDLTPVFEFLAPFLKAAASATKEWFLSLKDSKAVKTLAKYLTNARDAAVAWFDTLKESVTVQTLTKWLEKASKAVSKWIKGLKDSEAIKTVAKYLKIAKEAVVDWFKSFKQSDEFKKLIDYLKNSKDAIWEWIKGIKDAKNIPAYILSGLVNGLKAGGGAVIGAVIELGKSLLGAIKQILGIHSPSVEFFEIGKNMMEGLFNGIGAFVKMVYSLVLSVGTKLIEIIKGLDIGSVFTILLGGGMAFAFVKIARAIDLLTRPLEHVDDLVYEAKQTLEVFQGVLKSFKMRMYAESFKSIAMGIAILAGSLALLTAVDQGKLWSATIALGLLTAVLGGLVYVAGKYGSGSSLDFGKIALSLLGLATAMAIMALALRMISKIDPNKAVQTIIGFVGIVGALVLITRTIGKNGINMAKLGATFMGIAGAFLLMAFVARIIGGMNPDKLSQGISAILVFTLIIAGLMAATKLLSGSTNVAKIGAAITSIAGAFLMMALVTKILGGMKPEKLSQGLAAITMFTLVVVGLMAATKLLTGSVNVAKIGGAIAGVAGAMLMMAIVARITGGMKPEHLDRGIDAITSFAVICAGLMAATRLIGGKDLTRVGATIMAIAIAVGILGVTAALLSLIDPIGLAKGVIAVGFLSLFVMGLIAVCKHGRSFMGTMIAITVAVGLLSLAIGLLALIDPNKLKAPVIALGIILGMFALVIASTGLSKDAMTTMITIGACIGVLAFTLSLLAKLPWKQTLAAAGGMAVLLLAMAGALAIMSTLGPTAMSGMGALALMAVIVASLAAILGVLGKYKLAPTMEVALALSTMLLAMSAALVLLAAVGLLGPAAFIGIGTLATLIAGIGGLIVGIGALFNKFPMLETFLNTGIPVLNKIGNAIGSFFGNIVSGFSVSAASGLPVIGLMLSQFMVNATPFIAGIGNIKPGMLAGVGILSASILLLSAAEFINGIVSFLSFGSSLADLGTELSQFILNAMPFLTTVMLITPKMVEGIKTLSEAIMIITAANFVESISSFLTGGSSMEDFGSQLSYLAKGLREFITELGPVTPEQITSANNAATIIKTLAEAAKALPNSGGWLGKIVGENDMDAWSKQLPTMAQGIVDFTKVLVDNKIGSEALTSATNAADIIKVLAGAASEISNTGGLLADLVGDNDLSTFADELPNVAKGIVGFINAMSEGGVTTDKVEVANTAAKIIKTLAQAASEIPNVGGKLAELIGDNDLSTFAEGLPDVGVGIAGFADKIGTFDTDKLATIKTSVEAVKVVANMTKQYGSIKDSGDFSSFGSGMVTLAGKIKTFVSNMSEISSEKVSASITKIKDILDLSTTVAETDVKSLSTFGDSLAKAGKKGVKEFIDAIDSKTSKEDAVKAAKKLIQAVIDGIGDKGKLTSLKNEAKKVAQAAINAMHTDTLKTSATSAGKDLVQGLINGLKDNKKRTQVYNAAFSLGQLAVQGELDGQDSASPSKATMKAGRWLGEGLIIGMKKMGRQVYGAGRSIGEEATNSISNALDTALNLLNSDMDSQPTIRPVLDLSEVESGAGYLNSMFDNDMSVGVMANLRSISSGMNARIQNGSNSDIVSAINKLRGDLGNVGGTTNNYNFDGVTYDDGSGIADAVGAIVRAAKIGRRT